MGRLSEAPPNLSATVTTPKEELAGRRRYSTKRISSNNQMDSLSLQPVPKNLQSRYEKLMNFDHTKQLDKIKDNLQIVMHQSRKNMSTVPKKVMFSEDVIIKRD